MGFGKDGKGVIFRQRDTITLLTLGALTALKQNNPPALADSLRIIKSEGIASIRGATSVDGDGPIELWLASDDLTTAEIVEAIAVTGGIPLSREDRVGNERAMRPVFYLGILQNIAIGNAEGGWKVEWSRNIRWTFGDEASFTIVAFNRGSSALTTGGSIDMYHTVFGVWVGA